MPSVLLGLCEEPVTNKMATCWNVNKLGGMPDWYQSADLHPNCSLCGHRSVFICQLYCPISGSLYHRTLFVFACCNQPCRNKEGSWTVLRFQSPYKPEPKKLLVSKCDTDYWGIDEASWSDDDDDNEVDQNGIAESELPKHDTEAGNAKNNSGSLMDIRDCEPAGKQDEAVTSCYANGETNSKITPNRSVSADEEAATKMSQLSVMDVGCTEMEANSSTSTATAADEDEVAVAPEDLQFDPKDSILSKVLVNSQLSSSSEGSCSLLKELVSIVLDGYYINAYDETEFVADTRHWSNLEKKYLKEDSALRSFLQGWDELPNGKQRKEKKGKKSNHLDIEKDNNNEYDRKPDNFDPAVVKFSEKLKSCPHQVIRYSYHGTPLHFYEQGLKQMIPICTCGSPRIFEMQLMPGIVDYLRLSKDSDCAIEFGSVYIYTCANNCWEDERTEAKQEFIFSMEYLDQGLFRT